MFGQPKNNPRSLRVIHTARSVEEMNSAASKGFRPLVKKVEPSKNIHNMIAVYQHNETGEIQVVGDFRSFLGEEYTRVIDFFNYYQYSFPEPFAAYLIPEDLEEGENVWLDDVIEDVVAVYGNQGWHPRLESCEAIWQKGQFKLLFDPEKDAPVLIG